MSPPSPVSGAAAGLAAGSGTEFHQVLLTWRQDSPSLPSAPSQCPRPRRRPRASRLTPAAVCPPEPQSDFFGFLEVFTHPKVYLLSMYNSVDQRDVAKAQISSCHSTA